MEKPIVKPIRPFFSSGPCVKRLGWNVNVLQNALLGRSHRSASGKAKLKEVTSLIRELLGVPDNYKIGIVPASDTGAVEMAIWNMIGAKPVDVFAWENFSSTWLKDIVSELKIKDVFSYEAPYGEIADLSKANPSHDTVFVYNGTTSGVRVPTLDWISKDREGITICDATSAAFAYKMDWSKLDVFTFSWQKVLGGEAAHGILILSPKAIERLKTYTPENRPLPKIFKLTKKGEFLDGIFNEDTINTPSMLCVEDAIDALNWAKNLGGENALIAKTEANFKVIEDWVNKTPWIEFLASKPQTRSTTSVCLSIKAAWFDSYLPEKQWEVIKRLCKILETEEAAFDIKTHTMAPAGLRIWCGATTENSDIKALLPWIEYAYETTKEEFENA